MFVYLPRFGSGHGETAAHMEGLCPRSSAEPPWLLKDVALHPVEHSAAVPVGSSCCGRSGVHTNINVFLASDFVNCTIVPDNRADFK